MAQTVYCDGTYLAHHPDWHEADAPWKAAQVCQAIRHYRLLTRSVVEVGCGGGTVLAEVRRQFSPSLCVGYDIAPEAIARAKARHPEVEYRCGDAFADGVTYDLLLALDVAEHAPDLDGFLRACQSKANWKLYHLPLDICVLNVALNRLDGSRVDSGHLHTFMASTALAWLRDTGHEVCEVRYTAGAQETATAHSGLKLRLGNAARRIVGSVSVPLAARLLGGYSLLVLAR